MKKTRRFRKRRGRYSRDPESAEKLFQGLRQLDPSNTGSPLLRTGTNAYISLERIENAFVLADYLRMRGYEKLSHDLSRFALGVMVTEGKPITGGYKLRGLKPMEPSMAKWKALATRVRDALIDMRGNREKPTHWWVTRFRGPRIAVPVVYVRPGMSEAWKVMRPLLGRYKGRNLMIEVSEIYRYPPEVANLLPGSSVYLSDDDIRGRNKLNRSISALARQLLGGGQ